MKAPAFVEQLRELWKRAINLATGVRDVGPAEGAEMIRQGAAILDVRDPPEWVRGIIPGSILIPLAELPAKNGELRSLHRQPILVVCHGGKRSAKACRILHRSGNSGAVNLAGGILAWKRAGLGLGVLAGLAGVAAEEPVREGSS